MGMRRVYGAGLTKLVDRVVCQMDRIKAEQQWEDERKATMTATELDHCLSVLVSFWCDECRQSFVLSKDVHDGQYVYRENPECVWCGGQRCRKTGSKEGNP